MGITPCCHTTVGTTPGAGWERTSERIVQFGRLDYWIPGHVTPDLIRGRDDVDGGRDAVRK